MANAATDPARARAPRAMRSSKRAWAAPPKPVWGEPAGITPAVDPAAVPPLPWAVVPPVPPVPPPVPPVPPVPLVPPVPPPDVPPVLVGVVVLVAVVSTTLVVIVLEQLILLPPPVTEPLH